MGTLLAYVGLEWKKKAFRSGMLVTQVNGIYEESMLLHGYILFHVAEQLEIELGTCLKSVLRNLVK